MYAGRVVESASVEDVYEHPRHPYNLALQKSIPALQRKGIALYTIPGAPPDLSKPVQGCAFAPRCDYAQDQCRRGEITLKEVEHGHASACLRVQKDEVVL